MPTQHGVYLFSTKHVPRVQLKKRPTQQFTVPFIEPPIGTVQGKTPNSTEEWRVALALNRLKMKFIYQYAINGGHRLRGGQVVDFMVLTAPVPTPVYVNGEYWHRTVKQMEDEIKQLNVVYEMHGQCFQPLILWAHDLISVDRAYLLLIQKLRYK